jgi:hypothetical protein
MTKPIDQGITIVSIFANYHLKHPSKKATPQGVAFFASSIFYFSCIHFLTGFGSHSKTSRFTK